MSSNPFKTAHYKKIKLNKEVTKRVQKVYSNAAKDIEKRLNNLVVINPSDKLKKAYLEDALQDINKVLTSTESKLMEETLKAGLGAGQIAIDASNASMRGYGLNVTGALYYVPRKEVENIVSGKLYGGDWTLSKAIWNASFKTKSDVQKVVAQGLAENKSVKDIADDITKYVDPSARKPWDWNKVYPGTAQKVDYNAQRLVRTMIQHSYQNSLVQAQQYNPFCKGIIWHSVGLHGRTCELCLERDGNVFPVKDLPLDHPNGLCYFEPALDSMDDVADRLANWVGGGSDPALDKYVTKGLGLELNTPEGKKAVEKVKQQTSALKFSPEAWLKGAKKNTEADMLALEDKMNAVLTADEKHAIYKYSGSSYERINEYLRAIGSDNYEFWPGDDIVDTCIDLHTGFDKLIMKEDIYLRRGSSMSDLVGIVSETGYDSNMARELNNFINWDWLDSFDTFEEAVESLNMKYRGTIGKMNGMVSTSSIYERGFVGNVEYVIKAPKGTRGTSIMNISQFGTDEGEFLLDHGQTVEVKGIYPSVDGHMRSKIRVFLEVIP